MSSDHSAELRLQLAIATFQALPHDSPLRPHVMHVLGVVKPPWEECTADGTALKLVPMYRTTRAVGKVTEDKVEGMEDTWGGY